MRLVTLIALIGFLAAAVGCGTKGNDAPAPRIVAKPDDDPPPIPDGETFDDPTYKVWARFPPGTSVTQRTTTENEETKQQTVTTITYTLKERTDRHVLIEFQAKTTHWDGRSEDNPPQELRYRKTYQLPKGAKKDAPAPKGVETGDEMLVVCGKEYATRWEKSNGQSDAGEIVTQTWSCPDIPGGLAKSVSTIPARKGKITVEVTEVKVP